MQQSTTIILFIFITHLANVESNSLSGIKNLMNSASRMIKGGYKAIDSGMDTGKTANILGRGYSTINSGMKARKNAKGVGEIDATFGVGAIVKIESELLLMEHRKEEENKNFKGNVITVLHPKSGYSLAGAPQMAKPTISPIW